MAIEHYAILAEISYVNFSDDKFLRDRREIPELLRDESDLSESQINSFVENYEVIKHISQPSNRLRGRL